MPALASELEPLEIAFLGVLSLGLPPSRAAGDDTFRVDHCTAVTLGLQEACDRGRYLADGGPRVTGEFGRALRTAMQRLGGLGVLADQPAGMPAAPGGFEAGLAIDLVHPDHQPTVLDRGLAQQCMELLLANPDVYPFLMGQYARAGEFWRRAREEGYGR